MVEQKTLNINDGKYGLNITNYYLEETKKKKIIIGATLTSDMGHYIGWLKRLNGCNTKTSTFTIGLDGQIYQHFDPRYYSDFLGDIDIDKESISILLVNEGWLDKIPDKNEYVDWFGREFERDVDVYRKRWRSMEFWAPYTKEQFQSCLDLCEYLCKEYKINKNAIPHNTKIKNTGNYKGILYRANFRQEFGDLNPSWDYNGFTEKINEDETTY